MKQPNTATIYNTAIYCRLSKDDGIEQDSSSIQTQKEMLTRYCKEKGFIISGIYVDDGYSGTTTNRPEFQKMLADIEDGKINCVITKDLSRLGRNYLDTGAYTEIYFPEHNVRYIAVNDNVDTLYSSTMEITPFRNLLNDMYAADVSKKVKSALLTRQKQGKFIGNKAPYGYKKNPEDNSSLIIDEQYAPVVRRIFELSKNGMGINGISKLLRAEKIPRPAYAAADILQGYGRYIENDEDVYAWKHGSVRDILRNPVYAGHLRGQQRVRLSLKSKKRMNNGASGAFIIENCHEPIIPPKEWELVQQLIDSRRRTLPDGEEKYENIFSGLLKCDTCGTSLTASVDRRRKREFLIDKVGYQCNNYRLNGKTACTHHWIEARDLYNAVLDDIKRVANAAIENDEKMLDNIVKKLRKNETDITKHNEKELKKMNRRLAELDRLFAKLYEDNVIGKVNDRNFRNLSAGYEKEQLELEEKISALTAAIKEDNENSAHAEDFVQAIKEYADITELNAAMLNALIEKIVVHEWETVNDEEIQTVEVFYKFVGVVD